jgi:hypothetical protein
VRLAIQWSLFSVTIAHGNQVNRGLDSTKSVLGNSVCSAPHLACASEGTLSIAVALLLSPCPASQTMLEYGTTTLQDSTLRASGIHVSGNNAGMDHLMRTDSNECRSGDVSNRGIAGVREMEQCSCLLCSCL